MLSYPKNTYIIVFLLFTAQLLTASNLDSLSSLLQIEQKKSGSNQEKVLDLMTQISQIHFEQEEFEKALSVLDLAIPKAKKIKDLEVYQTLMADKAQVYLSTDRYLLAIETLIESIEHLKQIKDGNLAKAYTRIAGVYQKIGNHDLAYEYHMAGLEIYEEEKDSVNIGRSLYNIGSIFFYQDNCEIAIEYYQKTLDICKATKSERHIFSCLTALGGAYSRLHQTDKSLDYNLRAYELGKRLGLTSRLSYAVINLGANYAAKGDTIKALEFYEEAQALNEETNDFWGQCATLRLIGDILIQKGQFKKGYDYLMEVQKIAQQKGYRTRIKELHSSLARYYEKIGDYKQSIEHLEQYVSMKDSLANEASLQKMSDSKTRYEILQKEKELALKDAKFIIQQRTFLLLGICILSICLWLLVKQNRLKAKNNKVLAQKNIQIKKQNEELATAYALQKETNEKIKEQNRQLEQSNIELKRFAFIASHDLKEPLRTIGSYANLLQRRYKNKIDDNANEFLDYITDSAKRLYTLLNDVLDYSKLNVSKKERELTDANEAIQIANENLKTKIAKKNAHISIGELPKLTADKLHLVQLFQNLIDNSIKYSESQRPTVEIASTENNGFYQFSIKDNGIGIDPELQPKIFEMFKRLHTRDKFDGNGIGLAICKKIVQEYGGDIWVESAEGKGSTFYFTFPVPEKEMGVAA